MGDGLRLVAKRCGGLITVANGKTVRFDANGRIKSEIHAKFTPDIKSMKQLGELIEKLSKQFSMNKINLVHARSGTEGIWAIPVDAAQKKLWRNDASHDELFYVRVANLPLGWCGVPWGGLVAVRTKGKDRPCAVAADQRYEALQAHNKKLFELVAAEMAKQEAKKEKKSGR